MNTTQLRRYLKARSDRVSEVVGLVSTDIVRFNLTLGQPDGGWIESRGERRIRLTGLVASLAVREVMEVGSDDRPTLRSSWYTLSNGTTGLEVFAYHAHPPDPSFVHLHIEAGAGTLIDAIHKAHFPAAGTTLEDVVRLLIRDFGARPRRRDWNRILASF